MGRKIPAKKHRGVKDPLEQQARRLQSLKGKINAPPKDPDEQPIPRSVTRLFAFRDKDNTPKKKKKPKETPRDLGPVSGVGENPITKLKKLPGESGRSFSLRINSAIRTLHDPLEQEYPQDLEAEDVKGSQMAAQRARRQRKRGRSAPAAPGDPAAPAPHEKLSRARKLALKSNAKKEKAAEEGRGEPRYERVAFGDVAHAPPALPVRPRPRRAPPAPSADAASRPGRRELLLSALLAPGGAGGAGGGAGGGGGGRRRALAPGEAMRRERARLEAVAAYRHHKKLMRNDTKKK